MKRSKAVVLPMLFVPVLLLIVLPLIIGLIASNSQAVEVNDFLTRLPAGVADPITSLPREEQMVVLVNGYLLAPLFLSRSGSDEPFVGASVMASRSGYCPLGSRRPLIV